MWLCCSCDVVVMLLCCRSQHNGSKNTVKLRIEARSFLPPLLYSIRQLLHKVRITASEKNNFCWRECQLNHFILQCVSIVSTTWFPWPVSGTQVVSGTGLVTKTRLISVQITLTSGLYPTWYSGPGLYAGPVFYPKFYGTVFNTRYVILVSYSMCCSL